MTDDFYLVISARLAPRCAVLKARPEAGLYHFGGYSERATPLPIPNRVVKPLSADGTWLARAWESRSPPFFSAESVMPAPPIPGGAAHACSLVARPCRHGAHAHLCAGCHRAGAPAQTAAQCAAVGMRASQRPLGPCLGSTLVAQQREVEDAVDEPAEGPRVRVASGGGEEHVFAG